MVSENNSYNETVLEHFRNPRNAGNLPNANAIGEEKNPVCGDYMRLMLRIENEVISKAKFLTKGCGAAIATSSIATELLQGKRVEEARALQRSDLVEAVGGLPSNKVHCSVLAIGALTKALQAYDENQGVDGVET
jgi:nitrogen fixation NifU-like protein